ncbi:MAG TPA: hypothetical protein VKU19_13020 [Bryobacteraceae bacterium]|nr:hypothetical protein [Bryobacteraceae bacterium]
MAAAAAMYRSREREPETNSNETRDTLFLLGGLSLILFGAGLVLTNPSVRKLLGGLNVGNLTEAALPDIERYLKLRSM